MPAAGRKGKKRSAPMAGRWLIKEEPSHYSFEDLERDGKTLWEGVKNPLARKHLREIRRGDSILYYHTGKEKAVVGIARASSGARAAPRAGDAGAVAVEVEPVKPLPAPVPLQEIKNRPALKDMPLVRISRLSVMPVSEREWREIESMSRELAAGKSAARR
jgi:predicted RNA-binding protein with PUA-like domain